MSGHKESAYEIEARRQEELRRQREHARAAAQLASVQHQMEIALEQASPGLRRSFRTETMQAQQWLSTVGSKDQSTSRLLLCAEQGRRTLAELRTAYTQIADQTARNQSYQLAEFEAEVIMSLEQLQRWSAEPVEPVWQARIVELRDIVERQEYHQFAPVLARERSRLAEAIRLAEELDDKHERRLYLLKAIRQAACDLRWHELGEPEYEQVGNLRSRIIYKVDTRIRGTIRFSIGLDLIASTSDILDSHCVNEFDRLSELMRKQFGVQTKFRVPGADKPPKKVQRGERDVPGPARQIEATRS